MIRLHELVAYIDNLLDTASFQDYAPNGLQVEGRIEVRKLVSGVTACQALLDAAVDAQADAILVHHGYFWKNEDSRITGMKRRRLGRLLANDISLLAYHLPLDAHPVYGNNVQLASALGIEVAGRFGPDNGPDIAAHGRVKAALTGDEFSKLIAAKLGRIILKRQRC